MNGQDGLPSAPDAKLFSVVVSPTITAAGYTTGKALGGRMTIASAVRFTSGPAKLVSIIVADKAGQKSALDVLLFNQAFTATADTATIAISVADSLNSIGSVNVPAASYIGIGTPAVATVSNIQLAVEASGGTSLYAQLICRGSPTYTSTSDIQVTFVFERE